MMSIHKKLRFSRLLIATYLTTAAANDVETQARKWVDFQQDKVFIAYEEEHLIEIKP